MAEENKLVTALRRSGGLRAAKGGTGGGLASKEPSSSKLQRIQFLKFRIREIEARQREGRTDKNDILVLRNLRTKVATLERQ